MVTFSLSSDELDPEILSRSLQMKPSASWRQGDIIVNRNGLQRKEGNWEISTGYQDSLDTGNQLQAIYSIIYPKREVFMELIRLHNLHAKFDIVIKVKNGETPGMSLERDILDLAHDLRAVFGVDLYVD